MKVAFTGHRTIHEDFDYSLFDRSLKFLIEYYKADTFFDGMAKGFDLLAAQKIIQFKRDYDLKLIACIPFGGQVNTLDESDRATYRYVLENCDDIKVLSAEYYPGCMYARNRYMVDNADGVYSYFKGERGGTYYTLNYAKKSKKLLFVI